MTEYYLYVPAPYSPKDDTPWLSLNQHLHKARKAIRVDQWQVLARHVAENKGLPKRLGRVQITAYIHRTDSQAYDCQNYRPTVEAAICGLVRYGLIDSDNESRLVGPYMRRGLQRKRPGVTLAIEVLDRKDGPGVFGKYFARLSSRIRSRR